MTNAAHRAWCARCAWSALMVVTALGMLTVAGCATGLHAPGAAAPPPPVLADAFFAPAPALPPPEQALAMTPAMQAYLAQRLQSRPALAQNPQQALLEALYQRTELQLDYDATVTRDAAQAFTDRRGNCLSLVLMTAAFAREMGLAVQFNEVAVAGDWRAEGDLLLRSGHVNLTLRSREQTGLRGHEPARTLMVDFLPGQDLGRLTFQPVSQARVLAMFHNNRAAELLAQGEPRLAYWLARRALQLDPGFDAARNTLGVVYQRSGQLTLAAASFDQVLARRPDDASALANLALVYLALGQPERAAALRLRLASQPGDQALALHLRKLRQAQALVQQGLPRQAEQALEQALAASPGPAEQARYAGKLAWLRAQTGLH